MKLYLIVAEGKHQGLPIRIQADLFLIGSEPICQLRSKLQGIAPRHCALVTRERKVFVQDLDSGQPTLVNGDLVPPGTERPVHAADRLEVGPLEFLIQFREKALSQRDLEEWALKCLDMDSEKTAREFDDENEEGRPQLVQRCWNASQAAAAMLHRLQQVRGEVQGRLRVSQQAGVTIIRFNDRHLVEESEIALVRDEILDILTRPNLRVLLDFKNVTRMSSMAVAMLLALHRSARSRASTLALCRLRPELQGVLKTLKIFRLLPHFDDKRTALTTRWS